jgi:hypothetical protein
MHPDGKKYFKIRYEKTEKPFYPMPSPNAHDATLKCKNTYSNSIERYKLAKT